MKLISIEEANLRLKRKNFKVIDKYKFMSKIARIQCINCGFTWDDKPNNCLPDNYYCSGCNGTLKKFSLLDKFKTDISLVPLEESTYLYVFDILNIGTKIGISNKPVARLGNFKRRNELDSVNLSYTLLLPSRSSAAALEKYVHALLWRHQIKNLGLEEGFTEIFSITPEAAIELINFSYEQLFSFHL